MVPRNVSDAVEPPRPAPREMRPQSPVEARKLLDAAQGDRLEALYVLAVHTGMRQGEPLALKWQDVDLENATVSVRRTLTRSGGLYTLGEPKTKKSCRSIRLTTRAADALGQHLERQLSEMQMLGDAYANQGLVFTRRQACPSTHPTSASVRSPPS
jgi:integrase